MQSSLLLVRFHTSASLLMTPLHIHASLGVAEGLMPSKGFLSLGRLHPPFPSCSDPAPLLSCPDPAVLSVGLPGLPAIAPTLLACLQGGSTQKGCLLSWAAWESRAARSAPAAGGGPSGAACWGWEDGLWVREAGKGLTAGASGWPREGLSA